jgi:hypothetical protein
LPVEKGLLGLNRFSTFKHPLAVTIQSLKYESLYGN